jgi:hypothetical protein
MAARARLPAAPIKSCQAPSVTDRPQRRRKGMAADSGLLFQQDRDPPRAKCVAGEAEPCSAALAGDRERSGGLRTCRRPSLLFRGRFAGERGRRCRQDFSLGRKPMLIGLTVYATMSRSRKRARE